jgi:hypothetical protein
MVWWHYAILFNSYYFFKHSHYIGSYIQSFTICRGPSSCPFFIETFGLLVSHTGYNIILFIKVWWPYASLLHLFFFHTIDTFIQHGIHSFIHKHSLRPIFLLHSRRLSGRNSIIIVDQEKVPKTRTIT